MLLYPMIVFICSCTSKPEHADPDLLKSEILAVENAFAEAAGRDGVKQAFLAYAADGAVLVRGNRVIRGKEEMEDFFDQSTHTDVELKWGPDFVDVSSDGDMAYTYGPYTYRARDTSGADVNLSGIFHTVWKRQVDGTWKFVYD